MEKKDEFKKAKTLEEALKIENGKMRSFQKILDFSNSIENKLEDCWKEIPFYPADIDDDDPSFGFDTNREVIFGLEELYEKIANIDLSARCAIELDGQLHLGWRFSWSMEGYENADRIFSIYKEKLPNELILIERGYEDQQETSYESYEKNISYFQNPYDDCDFEYIIFFKRPISDLF